jgi:hypothetical protein
VETEVLVQLLFQLGPLRQQVVQEIILQGVVEEVHTLLVLLVQAAQAAVVTAVKVEAVAVAVETLAAVAVELALVHHQVNFFLVEQAEVEL